MNNPFAPENLSPLPTIPRPCELPYGLTWEDLLPILSGFDPNRGDQAQAFASHMKQGLNGGENSNILTLRYPGREGELLSLIVFVKSQRDPRSREAEKYRCLAAHGVPTPRLLAELHKADAEVIILEFLPKIGVDFASLAEVNDLLHLAAKIHSLPIPPGLFDAPPGMAQEEFDRLVEDALQCMARNPSFSWIDAAGWFAAYRQCQDEENRMPLAVNHNQFYFQQTGWAGRKLVIFDMETMCVRPRFVDLATILYPLSRYTGRTQEDLLTVYLDHHRTLNGHPFNLAGALRELRVLRVVEMCSSLPWLSGEVKDPASFDIFSGLSMAAACLVDDLDALELAK